VNRKNETALTQPYRALLQSLGQGVTKNSQAIASLSPSVPPPATFGIVSGNGVPVAATSSGDTLALTSADGTVSLATNPATKTIDLSTSTSTAGLSGLFAAVSYRA